MKACEIIDLVRVEKLPKIKLQEAKTKILNRIRSLKSQLSRKKFTTLKKQNRKHAILVYLESIVKDLV